MSNQGPWLVFDVESVGLHGEGWAVGWLLGKPVDGVFNVESEGLVYCRPGKAVGLTDDLLWVQENCHADGYNTFGGIEVDTPREVRDAFWDVWVAAKGPERHCTMAADCTWPVEARFLCAMIDDGGPLRRWEGPYPLIDIATARLVAGLTGQISRLPDELPVHNPLADTRQSARLLAEALRK
jgi:hypothetical protein